MTPRWLLYLPLALLVLLLAESAYDHARYSWSCGRLPWWLKWTEQKEEWQ